MYISEFPSVPYFFCNDDDKKKYDFIDELVYKINYELKFKKIHQAKKYLSNFIDKKFYGNNKLLVIYKRDRQVIVEW